MTPATKVLSSNHKTLPKPQVTIRTKHFPGIIHKSRPIFGTQFHPEARGGPLDSSYLFDTYLESVTRYKRSQTGLGLAKEGRPSPLLVDLLAKERVGVVPEGVLARAA